MFLVYGSIASVSWLVLPPQCFLSHVNRSQQWPAKPSVHEGVLATVRHTEGQVTSSPLPGPLGGVWYQIQIIWIYLSQGGFNPLNIKCPLGLSSCIRIIEGYYRDLTIIHNLTCWLLLIGGFNPYDKYKTSWDYASISVVESKPCLKPPSKHIMTQMVPHSK